MLHEAKSEHHQEKRYKVEVLVIREEVADSVDFKNDTFTQERVATYTTPASGGELENTHHLRPSQRQLQKYLTGYLHTKTQ